MNLRNAQIELEEPPRVRPSALLLEAVGLLVFSYFLVGWLN